MPGLTRDVYIALGEPLEDGSWTLRLHYKPLVRWVWYGALLMAIGGLVAIADPRYRRLRSRDRVQTAHIALVPEEHVGAVPGAHG